MNRNYRGRMVITSHFQAVLYGKQSGKNLSPEKRKERARKAIATRWEKVRQTQAAIDSMDTKQAIAHIRAKLADLPSAAFNLRPFDRMMAELQGG